VKPEGLRRVVLAVVVMALISVLGAAAVALRNRSHATPASPEHAAQPHAQP
jgi:hypothetical protein